MELLWNYYGAITDLLWNYQGTIRILLRNYRSGRQGLVWALGWGLGRSGLPWDGLLVSQGGQQIAAE